MYVAVYLLGDYTRPLWRPLIYFGGLKNCTMMRCMLDFPSNHKTLLLIFTIWIYNKNNKIKHNNNNIPLPENIVLCRSAYLFIANTKAR